MRKSGEVDHQHKGKLLSRYRQGRRSPWNVELNAFFYLLFLSASATLSSHRSSLLSLDKKLGTRGIEITYPFFQASTDEDRDTFSDLKTM